MNRRMTTYARTPLSNVCSQLPHPPYPHRRMCVRHPFGPVPPAQTPPDPDCGDMSHTPGPGTRSGSFLGEVRDAVTPRATLLVLGVIALQLLFIASYVGA